MQGIPAHQVFGPVLAQHVVPKESWEAKYPAVVGDSPARRYLATLAPAFFFAFAAPQITPPALSWHPIYPDFARGAFLSPAQVPFVATRPILPPPAPYSASFYPDFVLRGGLDAPYQRATWLDPYPIPNAPVDVSQFAWRPGYPDQLLPGGLHPARMPFEFRPDRTRPTFFDALSPAWIERRIPEPRDWTVNIFTSAITPPLAWAGWSPSDLIRTTWQAARQLAFFRSPGLVLTALAIRFTDEALSPALFTAEALSATMFTDETLVTPMFTQERIRPV